MNKNPLFSVIIPVKGRLHFAKEAIDSVLTQRNIKLTDVEIIIIEEKNPPEIIRHELKKLYPQVKIVLNKFEDCSGGSRNSGLETARGTYIIFLDSDDQLHPDFLYKMSKSLDEDKNAAGAVCFSKAIFSPGYNWQEYIKWHMLMLARDASLLLFYLFRRGNLNPSAFYLCQISHMMFKKKAVGKMRFDYKYRYGGEDWDFISRVLEKGNIRIISGRLTIFRYSYNSSTVNPINKINKWKSYLQLGESLPSQMKKSFYYKLFLQYIALFKPRN